MKVLLLLMKLLLVSCCHKEDINFLKKNTIRTKENYLAKQFCPFDSLYTLCHLFVFV